MKMKWEYGLAILAAAAIFTGAAADRLEPFRKALLGFWEAYV